MFNLFLLNLNFLNKVPGGFRVPTTRSLEHRFPTVLGFRALVVVLETEPQTR